MVVPIYKKAINLTVVIINAPHSSLNISSICRKFLWGPLQKILK